MAKGNGSPDLMLQLLAEVRQVQADLHKTETGLRQVQLDLQKATAGMGRFAKVLAAVAKETKARFADHERRLTALESRGQAPE